MTRFIIFLIRRRFGLGKYELFRFNNQKSEKDCYYFSAHGLKKVLPNGRIKRSNVSLNWILDNECKIIPVEKTEAVSIVWRMRGYSIQQFNSICSKYINSKEED